jgi:hypothetical protein
LHIAGTGGIIPSIFTAEYPKWPDGPPLKIELRTKVGANTVIVGRQRRLRRVSHELRDLDEFEQSRLAMRSVGRHAAPA